MNPSRVDFEGEEWRTTKARAVIISELLSLINPFSKLFNVINKCNIFLYDVMAHNIRVRKLEK